MVHEAAPIVADNSANALGDAVDLRQELFDRHVCPFGAIDRLIEIAQVCGMVLVMMDLHRQSVNPRLECRVIVR